MLDATHLCVVNMRGHRFHGLKRLVHSKLIDIQHLYSIYHGMHMGYPMFIQYLSLYCRTLWSLFLHIPLPSISLYLYEQSPTPILFVAPCQHVLGRVPLFPLFLDGNATPTIPYKYRQLQRAKFPHGSTDSSNAAGRKGSNVYEVNLWLWQFGRGKPLLGNPSVADKEVRQTELQTDSHRRAVETRKRALH